MVTSVKPLLECYTRTVHVKFGAGLLVAQTQCRTTAMSIMWYYVLVTTVLQYVPSDWLCLLLLGCIASGSLQQGVSTGGCAMTFV